MFQSVRSRLYVSTGVMIALFWVVALAGINALRGFNGIVDDLVSDDVVVFALLSDLREANLLNRIYWREAIHGVEAQAANVKVSFANPASMSKAMAEEETMAAAVRKLQEKSPSLDSHDQELIRRLAAAMAKFRETSGPLQAAIKSGSGVAAASLQVANARDRELIPAINDYYSHKREEVGEAEEAAEKSLALSTKLVLAIALAATLIGGFVTVIISRSVALPLAESTRIANRMADGDFTVAPQCKENCGYGKRIRCNEQSCEVGQVNSSLGVMRLKLAEAVAIIQKRSAEAHEHSSGLADSMRVAVSSSRTQAEKVMQVSAATEQLNVSISEVATALKNVANASQNSSGQARSGVVQVQRSQEAMDAILAAAKQSGAAVGELQGATADIQNLTLQIKEIADQTNLLALNAAIEAARAGEAGRGFAVVADEVRKLAEKTGQTSSSIQSLAQGMITTVDGATQSIASIESAALSGVDLSHETSSALQQIVRETESVQEQIASISHASAEQRSAADSTAQAMEEIAALTEENDTAIDQIDQTAQELRGLADNLIESVAGFRVAAPAQDAAAGALKPAFAYA